MQMNCSVKFDKSDISKSLGALGGFMYISVFTGACRYANTKPMDYTFRSLVSVITSINMAVLQDTTGEYVFQ